jgi:hypothetical protein
MKMEELFECAHCGHVPEKGDGLKVNSDCDSMKCNKCGEVSSLGAVAVIVAKQMFEEQDPKPEPTGSLKDMLSALESILGLEEKCDEEPTPLNPADNNGGKTDYYQLPEGIRDFDDFAEFRKLNGNQFNIGKVFWTFNTGRHSGTDYARDLNKIIHYANRELNRIDNEGM